MVFYSKPRVVQGIIFDMDNTLYTNEAYTRHQEDVLVARLAHKRGESLEACKEVLGALRSSFATKNGGRKPSLGNAFLALGIPIAESIAWRKELIEPESFLVHDGKLVETVRDLAGYFSLSVVTNNPVSIAERTFRVLGLESLLTDIVGLDTFGVSKPDPRAFRHAAELMGIPPDRVLSVGDRYEIDIEPALGLGMGGALVAEVAELHGLRAILMVESN